MVAPDKVCTRCEVRKPLDDFPFRSKAIGTRHARCKPCMVQITRSYNHSEGKRARNREYHRENRAERNAGRSARFHADHPDQRHARKLAKYGLSPEDYAAHLIAQSGVCAICLKPETMLRPHTTGIADRLSVDHCHATGVVRGLLCSRCNVAVGMLGDDPVRLRAAASYLERALVAPDLPL